MTWRESPRISKFCAWTRALVPAVAVAVLLTGCGEAVDKRDAAASTTPAAAAKTSPRATTTTQRRAPNPPRSVPTRLVGGPAVFRMAGGAPARPEYGGGQLVRYIMIFRLNRPALHLPKDPGDKDGPTPLPDGAFTHVGNYSLGKVDFDFDVPFGTFDADDSTGDADNCFIGEIRSNIPGLTREFDPIALGEHVRVRLQPLTPKPGGGARLGTRYVRHPPMQLLRVRPEGASASRIVAPAERAKVQRIGCSATLIE